jgi:hypothetical protein
MSMTGTKEGRGSVGSSDRSSSDLKDAGYGSSIKNPPYMVLPELTVTSPHGGQLISGVVDCAATH